MRYNLAVRPFLTIALLLAASMSAQFACANEPGVRTGGTVNFAELFAKGVFCGGDLLQADGFQSSHASAFQSRWSCACFHSAVPAANVVAVHTGITPKPGALASRTKFPPLPVRGP